MVLDYLPMLFFVLVFVLIFGNALWSYWRSGSLIGSVLSGRIRRELGQIEVPGRMFTSQTLKVLTMETYDGEPFIGLALQFRGPGARRLDALKLSAGEVQNLIRLLQEAVEQGRGAGRGGTQPFRAAG